MDMNTTELVKNKKMLAIIIGVAILATAGVSAASAQVSPTPSQTPTIQGTINLQQTIMSNVKIAFPDAANTAATAVSGKVIGGSLTVAQGYVVYNFKVIDDKNMVYTVIVDPSSGTVLYKSTGRQFGMGEFGMDHGHMMHGHMGEQAWNSKAPSGNTTPSSDTTAPSGSQSWS